MRRRIMDKVIIKTANQEKYDINIQDEGWVLSIPIEDVISILREREYEEGVINKAVDSLALTGVATLKEAIDVTDKEQNIKYQKTATVIDPEAMGDNLRPLTALLRSAATEYSGETPEECNAVVVFWVDSDATVYEKSHSDLESALQDYNSIVGRMEEIHKLLSIEQADEARLASEELLYDLELGSEE